MQVPLQVMEVSQQSAKVEQGPCAGEQHWLAAEHCPEQHCPPEVHARGGRPQPASTPASVPASVPASGPASLKSSELS